MLILSRRPEEIIRIGDEITVTVLEIKLGQVRIGIEAPREVPVYRHELWLRLNTGPAANQSFFQE